MKPGIAFSLFEGVCVVDTLTTLVFIPCGSRRESSVKKVAVPGRAATGSLGLKACRFGVAASNDKEDARFCMVCKRSDVRQEQR